MSETELAKLLEPARQVMVFTGAGISTGSGIRDFRGPQGVWKTRQPVYFDDFMSSEAARIEHWDQKLEAWPSFRDAQPNAVHEAIVALERAERLQAVITQNVDGLHERAGTSKDRLIEIHGTNCTIECMSCHALSEPGPHMDDFAASRVPPTCACGGFLKPATISFGQGLRPDDLRRATEAADACDLVIALGSTLSVYPAASFPLSAAERGVPYVVINRGDTDHDRVAPIALRLEGDVADWFPPAVEHALR